MVSQPDHPSGLGHRGGGSVVHAPASRSHMSRSRRYNRSHAGGTSYIPQNEFPLFSNSGDVEIIVRTAKRDHTNRYLLHRHTLTQCSGLFEASTSNEWSRARVLPASDGASRLAGGRSSEDGRDGRDGINNMALVPPRKMWRFELDWGDDDNDIPMLVQMDEDPAADPVAASSQSIFGGPPSASANPSSSRRQQSSSFFRSVANLALPSSSSGRSRHHHSSSLTSKADAIAPPHLSQADADILRDYDNMFRIFYNYPPVMDSVSLADAYVQCKSLLTLADQYDALAVVGPRADHHLLQFQSRLWKQVAKYPTSYLKIGYLARSRMIFQEALIHVVGQWPLGERTIRSSLPESVVELIECKVDDLEEAVAKAETKLFRLGLMTSRGERVTPQNGYLDWLAMSLFRQWLADNTAPAPPSPPPQPPQSGGVAAANMPWSSGSSTLGSNLRPGQQLNRHGAPGGNSNNHNSSHNSNSAVVRQSRQKSVPATLPPIAVLGRAYRIIGAPSGQTYLGHDECKRFLKLTPVVYTRDNLRIFEKRVEDLRVLAREVVRPLMGSGLELDASGAGRGAEAVGYLTCTIVEEIDLPWIDD